MSRNQNRLDRQNKSNNTYLGSSYQKQNSTSQKGGRERPMDSIQNYRQIIQQSRFQNDASQAEFDKDVVTVPLFTQPSSEENLTQSSSNKDEKVDTAHEIVALANPIKKDKPLQEKVGKALVISTDGTSVQPSDIVILDIADNELYQDPPQKPSEEEKSMRPDLNAQSEEIKVLTEEVKNNVQESLETGSLQEAFKKMTEQHGSPNDIIILDSDLDNPIQVETKVEESYPEEESQNKVQLEAEDKNESNNSLPDEEVVEAEDEVKEEPQIEAEDEVKEDVKEESQIEAEDEVKEEIKQESNEEVVSNIQPSNLKKELNVKAQKGESNMEGSTLEEKFKTLYSDNEAAIAAPKSYTGSYDQTGDSSSVEESTVGVTVVEQNEFNPTDTLSFDNLKNDLANFIHDQSDLEEYSTVRDKLDLQRNIKTVFDTNGSILLYSKIKFKAEPDNVKYMGKIQLEDSGIAYVYSYIHVPSNPKWGTQRPAFKKYYMKVVAALKDIISCKVKSVRIPFVNAHGMNVLADEEILAISKTLLSEGIRVQLYEDSLELTI